MREIKFRGKRMQNGEWSYGGICCFPDGRVAILQHIDIGPQYADYRFLVERKTVGQYTGLKDKNGKEIYEGDIIQLINEDLEEMMVVCEFGTARRQIFDNLVEITGFYFKRLCDDRKTFPIVNNYLGKHDLELFKVIGNIYENHELLER